MEFIMSEAEIRHSSRGKKRPSKPNQSKANIAKQRRNAGEQYVSKSTRRTIPGRTPPTGGKKCSNHCQLATCISVSVVDKQAIFHQYWRMGNFDKRRTFMLGLMEKIAAGPIRTSYRYCIVLDGKRQEVCQVTFLDIFQESKKVVEKLQGRLRTGVLHVVDGRGRHQRSSAQRDGVKQAMRNHIFQQAIEPVHYTRTPSLQFYLPPELNVARMFRSFIASNPQIPGVEQKGNLFYEAFNGTGIALQRPREDTCRVCDKAHIELQLANPNDEPEVRRKMHEHHYKADEGYRWMTADIQTSKADPSKVVKVVDLQQVLFSPTLKHSNMFYLRQFSSYNHCIFDGQTDRGFMYFWDETEGHRGVNELGSAFLHHIRAQYQPLQNGQRRSLTVWSDRCRGQNNNYNMVTLFLYLLKSRYFTSVEQKFLVSGHSYMPCDRMFAQIEKRKRVCEAFIPEDWIKIIEEAQPINPFVVTRLTQNLMFDLKVLENCFPRPPSFHVTEAAVIQVSANSSSLLTREEHGYGVWAHHTLYAPNQTGMRNTRRMLLDLNTVAVNLRPCYNGRLPLPEAKKENIRTMLPFLLPCKRQFYQNVLTI